MTDKTKMPTPEEFKEITHLAGEQHKAKIALSAAKADLVEVEVKLACLIPGPESGQRTINLADKRKIVVTRGFNYSADCKELAKLDLGEGFPPPIKSSATASLDEVGYEWYRKNRPELFTKIAEHVSAKPKKISVTIKEPK